MSGVYEERLFENDEFNPHVFSAPERRYLIAHMGETPRRAFSTEATQAPVNREGMKVALQRLFEERDDAGLMDKLRRSLELALEVDLIKREQTRRFGSVDYGAMGVGCGVGQTGIEKHFVVALSSKVSRDKGDPLKGLRQRWDGEEEEEPLPKLSAIPCAWCEYVGEGGKALKSLRMHVMVSHKDHKDHFRDVIDPALREGNIGPLQEAAELHDAGDNPEPVVDPADTQDAPVVEDEGEDLIDAD